MNGTWAEISDGLWDGDDGGTDTLDSRARLGRDPVHAWPETVMTAT